jgi:hypothetical protein
VLVLYLTMLCSVSFFWAQSEYPQAMAFMVLFLGLLLHLVEQKMYWWHWPLLLALLVTVVFFHPLVIVPCVMGIIYFWLNKNLSFSQAAVTGASLVAVYFLKSKIFAIGAYESSKMSGLKNFKDLFPDYVHLDSNRFFVEQLFSDYAGFGLACIVVFAFYTTQKMWLKCMWLSGSLLAYVLLVNVSFPNTTGGTYQQNLYLPLGFLIALPLAFEILPALKPMVWIPALAVLFLFRLFMIYDAHTSFTERQTYFQTLLTKLQSKPTNKFFVSEQELPKKVVGETWAISYETLLLSSLQSPENTQTIELEDVIDRQRFLLDSDFVFINRWWGWDGRALPTKYFNLRQAKYQQLTGSDL